jgi:hypothetical protein
MAAPLPPVPFAMLGWPIGTYGIAYDVFSRSTGDDLPSGWNARRGEISLRLTLFFNYTHFSIIR